MFVSNATCCSIEREIKKSSSEKIKQFMVKKKEQDREREREMI
jgi:hypothetical protein